jgi:DNA repair photolyase
VLIAPLMPGINETPEQVGPILERAREADASFLGGVALHLRDEVRDVFFGWLEAKRPDLLPKYEQLYSGGRAYMHPAQRQRVTRALNGNIWGMNRRQRPSPAPRGRPGRSGPSGSASRAGRGRRRLGNAASPTGPAGQGRLF